MGIADYFQNERKKKRKGADREIGVPGEPKRPA
jgi:hypothetical protein